MQQLLSAPLDVEFGITRKCQLRCDYCSAMPLLGDDVAFEMALEVITELGELGVFSLLMSGGEPTLHPYFMELMAAAVKAIPITSINTNGIRHSRMGFARAFYEVAPTTLVAISLDSIDVKINNYSRGAGGEMAIRAIENCVSIGQTVCISAVLTETNLASAIKLIERFSPHVRKFRFFPRVPRNARDVLANDLSYQGKVAIFYQELDELSRLDPDLDVITPSKSGSQHQNEVAFGGHAGCVCPQTKMYIDSRLRVYPCFYSATTDTCLGSCSTASLKDMWNSERAMALRTRASQQRLCGVGFGEQAIPNRYNVNAAQQGAPGDTPKAARP